MSCSSKPSGPVVCFLPGDHTSPLTPADLIGSHPVTPFSWNEVSTALGASLRRSFSASSGAEVFAATVVALMIIAISVGVVLHRRRTAPGRTADNAQARVTLLVSAVAALVAGACVVVLGAAVPAAADSTPTVTKEPITIGTIAVTLQGQSIAPDSTLTIVPGSVMSILAPLRNDGTVPIQLSLSSISLVDLKGLGSVTTWKVTNARLPKISGTLGGNASAQPLTTLKPGDSLPLLVQIQAPTNLDNRYQKTSMRFRLVLTENQTQ